MIQGEIPAEPRHPIVFVLDDRRIRESLHGLLPAMPIARALVLVAASCLTACAMLPPQKEHPFSPALPAPADSALARIARESVPDPTLSGFRLMPLGLYALDARIELARRASSSLDVQYYLIQDDRTGRLFMRSLRDAALRGVRVRLLVDDLYTAGADPMFQGLAAFSNVEVHLFNPFCCARQSIASRFAVSLADFRRLNHRMHNKLFIADGAIAVMGGRNIADEYFARSMASNFVDMDVLLVGNIVDQLAGIFDIYWNSPQAYPIEAILGEPVDPSGARARFDQLVEEGEQMRSVTVPPKDMLAQQPVSVDLDAGRLSLALGKAVAFADQPAKVMAPSAEAARSMSVQMNVMDRVVVSKKRVFLSSPYFIPGETGVESFADMTKRGVEVVILTNSLGANDEPLTHIGYARYRVGLIRAGVKLYELSPTRVKGETWEAIPGTSHGRLHAKVAVLDDSMVYIGSMNLDPRSDSTNTELGIVAQCPELARDVVRVIDTARRVSAYRLQFGPDGESLEWLVMGDPHEVVLSSEPDVGPYERFRDMLLGPFVPEQLL
jgi:cardiolipin synthase C